MLRIIFLLFLNPVFTSQLFSYPTMIRHGYVNCSTCHMSPTGGGVLTPYGRELSKELLSRSSMDNEQYYLYNLVRPPEWLTFGGNLKAIQVHRNDTQSISGKFIVMQLDMETVATYKSFFAGGTIGLSEPTGKTSHFPSNIISRRHYVSFNPTDELSLRIGKFNYAYGINTPDHILSIKRGLQIGDQGFESYNIESAWIGESWNILLTGIFGRPDETKLKRETGASLVVNKSFHDQYKLGMSYLNATSDTNGRHVLGPFGLFGFTPKLSLLSEVDFQNTHKKATSSSNWGLANYNYLSYEWTRGTYVYVTQEFLWKNLNSEESFSKSVGLGIQYFPRPHFEFNFSWQFQFNPKESNYTDLAWLMIHFYL